MDQGKICGVIIGLLGGWLLWGAWTAVAQQLQLGSNFADIFDPAFSIRVMAAIAAFVAGIAALIELKGGAWLAGIAAFLMGVLTISMIALGADKSLWQDEIIILFIMTALFLGIMVARGQSLTEEAMGDGTDEMDEAGEDAH